MGDLTGLLPLDLRCPRIWDTNLLWKVLGLIAETVKSLDRSTEASCSNISGPPIGYPVLRPRQMTGYQLNSIP